VPLNDTCQHCHKKSSWLERFTLPGYCSRCGGWLGSNEKTEDELHDKASYEDWVSRSVGEVLAYGKRLHSVSRHQMKVRIRALISKISNGSNIRCAEFLKVSTGRVRAWKSGIDLPALPIILKLCYRAHIPLTDFLDANRQPRTLERCDKLLRKGHNTKSLIEHRELLNLAEMATHENPPPSLTEVGRRIKLRCGAADPLELMHRSVPDLARQIKDRRALYDHEIREKRKVDLSRFATDAPDNPISPLGVAKQLGVSAAHLKRLCPESYETIRRLGCIPDEQA
jgi:hypothetical protein